MQFNQIEELLTCDNDYNQYGSLWGLLEKELKI